MYKFDSMHPAMLRSGTYKDIAQCMFNAPQLSEVAFAGPAIYEDPRHVPRL